jgi:hypothetical protein
LPTWACGCVLVVSRPRKRGPCESRWTTLCSTHVFGVDEQMEAAEAHLRDYGRVDDPAPKLPRAPKHIAEKAEAEARRARRAVLSPPATRPRPRPAGAPRPAQTCPQCGVTFIPVGPRICCSPACSEARWREQVRLKDLARTARRRAERKAARVDA